MNVVPKRNSPIAMTFLNVNIRPHLPTTRGARLYLAARDARSIGATGPPDLGPKAPIGTTSRSQTGIPSTAGFPLSRMAAGSCSRAEPIHAEIYVMRPDGTGQRRLRGVTGIARDCCPRPG
jgi:hypothetical protein